MQSSLLRSITARQNTISYKSVVLTAQIGTILDLWKEIINLSSKKFIKAADEKL